VSFGKTIPILRIFGGQKAKEFYVDFLGYQVDWEHRFEEDEPIYIQISKDDCILHLSEHYGDCTPGAAVRITCGELDAYCQELSAKGYAYCHPELEDMPYGTREMLLHDPFDNRLIFTSSACMDDLER